MHTGSPSLFLRQSVVFVVPQLVQHTPILRVDGANIEVMWFIGNPSICYDNPSLYLSVTDGAELTKHVCVVQSRPARVKLKIETRNERTGER